MGDRFRGNVVPSLIQHHVHEMNAGRRDVPMRIRGKVSSGLGRAHVFMAQTHYQEQFKQILGKTAWPGTLNVEVSGTDFVNHLALRIIAGIDSKDAPEDLMLEARKKETSDISSIKVEGFLRDGVSFGGATAFMAEISSEESVPCAVLIPDLTRHIDVVEVISTAFLRESLQVQDGDEVEIKVLV